MTSLADSFFKSLLQKFPNPALQDVAANAYPEMAQKVKSLSGAEGRVIETFFIYPQETLSQLHPSWFQDIVSFCPPAARESSLMAMRQEMGQERKTFSDPVRRFLLQGALSLWPERTFIGEIHPELELLKNCSSEDLLALVDLIGLYDLVVHVRKVVEKKRLQRVFERISPLQQKYLRAILQGKKFPIYVPLDFDAFMHMSPQEVSSSLRERGLFKLGVLLSNEKPATSWNVLHRMDKAYAPFIQEGRDVKNLVYDLTLLREKFQHAFQFLQR